MCVYLEVHSLIRANDCLFSFTVNLNYVEGESTRTHTYMLIRPKVFIPASKKPSVCVHLISVYMCDEHTA